MMTKTTLASLRTTLRGGAVVENGGILSKTSIQILLALVLGLTVSSCGSKSTTIVGGFTAQGVGSLQVVAGDGQVGTVGDVLPAPITVRVVTQGGDGVPGINVAWAFPNGAGSQSADGPRAKSLTSATDASGRVSVYWQLDTIAGDQQATATLNGADQTAASKRVVFHSHGKAAIASRVVVSPSSLTFGVGDAQQLTATVLDHWKNVISGADVAWSSSDAKVTSVSTGGIVTAGAKGTATVTAVSGNANGQSYMTVTDAPFASVASVSAAPQAVTLTALGATAQLSATASDASGTTVQGASFQWKSLNGTVAGVDGSGNVTALGDGTAQIVVTASGYSAADTVAVSVGQQADKIIVNPDSLSLQVGGISWISAAVLDANGHAIAGATVDWSSTDSTVASVDSSGMVSAKKTGSAKVRATSGGVSSTSGAAGASQAPSISGEASVNVSGYASSVVPDTVTDLRVTAISHNSVTLSWTQVDDGTGAPAKYALRYGSPTISWAAAAGTEVSVAGTTIGSTASYTFTGLASATDYQFELVAYRGTLNADAVLGGYSDVASALTTTPGTPQTAAVTATPASVSFTALGDTTRLLAVAQDSAGNTVANPGFVWTSLAPSVATVNSTGLVTAKAIGTAAIIVSVTCCTAADTVMVSVTQKAQQVMVNPGAVSLQTGSSSQLSASVLDANGNPVSGSSVAWSSSNTAVATVGSSGLVSAVSAGSATITAKSGTLAGTSSVVVSDPSSATDPGAVNDLRMVSRTDSTITLQWTQVDDGTGSPANYALRYGQPTLVWGSAYSTEVSVTGTAIGSQQNYTLKGLQPGTTYQVGLVSYRGTLNAGAVFGPISNFVSGSTTTSTSGATQTPTVTATPSSLSFASLNTTAQLTAVAKDSMGNTVANPGFSWSSLASSIASVSSSGLVTAKAVGATAIIVSAACCGADTVQVSVASALQPLTITTTSPLPAGTNGTPYTQTIKATGGDGTYMWSISGQPTWLIINGTTGQLNGTAVTGSYTFNVQVSSGDGQNANKTFSLTVNSGSTGTGTPAFQDGFETGNLSYSTNGYKWTSSANTVVSTDRAYSGTHSLKFTFGPDAPGDDSWSEQRFQMGRYLSSVWVEYMLYIPSNFYHRRQGGSLGADNNKFFFIWKDDYSQLRDWKPGYSDYPSNVVPGGSMLHPISTTYTLYDSYPITDAQVNLSDPFIGDGPQGLIRGQWNQVRLEFKAASGIGAKNGVMKVWINGRLFFAKTNGDFWNALGLSSTTLHNGYILGWSNSGFTNTTNLYVDNVKFFESDPGWR